MKRNFRIGLLTTFLCLGAVGPVLGQTAEPDTTTVRKAARVPWIKDKSWTEIVELAEAKDQPILIDFTAKWCGPCRLLDVMVFTEKSVITELAEVVTFQVDIDKPKYAAIKEAFAIELLPTVVWCDSQGNEVDRFNSYRSSDEFLEIVGGWRSNRTIDRMLAEQKSTSPEDPTVLLDLARRHAERGEDQQAEVQYRRLLNLRYKADTRTVVRGMLGLAELEEKAGNTRRSDNLVSQAVALYAVAEPTPEMLAYRTEGLMEIALFQEDRGDTLEVLETYRTIVQLDDREVLGLDGFARTAVAADVELE
jgi:thioredoxin-like negative regulator of GroEL